MHLMPGNNTTVSFRIQTRVHDIESVPHLWPIVNFKFDVTHCKFTLMYKCPLNVSKLSQHVVKSTESVASN